MKIVAHRGACTEALENSWDAFRKAVEIGADRIELDVHLTADGHLAILHDEDFERTAGLARRIDQMSRQEIESLKLSNGEAVPFLDQLMTELLPNIELNIEIKPDGPGPVEAVGKLVAASPYKDKVVISSFHTTTCVDYLTRFPGVRVALLWDKQLWWPGAFAMGPLRFMKKHGIRIFHPDARLLTPQIMKQARAHGIDVVPYIGLKRETDKERLWSFLMTLGVQGHCTNYPRQMKLWLQEAMDDAQRYKPGNILGH